MRRLMHNVTGYLHRTICHPTRAELSLHAGEVVRELFRSHTRTDDNDPYLGVENSAGVIGLVKQSATECI